MDQPRRAPRADHTHGGLWAAADLLVAIAAAVWLCRWGLRQDGWSDFRLEAGPSVQRLLAGDLHGFLVLSPAYGGSMILRLPTFALGGAVDGITGAYHAGAAECVAAVAVLALALAAQMRAAGQRAWARWLTIVLLVANPASAWALKEGHPEELLVCALGVAGVLLASRGRPTAAGVLLGLAAASKQWAVLLLPIAFAVAPDRRLRLALTTLIAATALVAPLVLAGAGAFVSANLTAAGAAVVFHSEQIWWTLGAYHMRPLGGPQSTIFGPATDNFVAQISHPMIAACAVAVGVAWWLRRRRLNPGDALLALALVMLLRCMLDPWNTIYYQLPFLVALATWEVCTRRRAPLLALVASLLVWWGFRWIAIYSNQNTTNLFYITWSIPASALMLRHALALSRPQWMSLGRERAPTLASRAR